MATDKFNSSYGYLLKLMVNTPLAFLSPSLLSVPRLILTNIQREPPNFIIPSNPHSSCCQAKRRFSSRDFACLVQQRIRRMHCLARRRVRHLRQTEIRSRLSRGKEACDVAGFSAFNEDKIGDNSEDRSRCRRRRRLPHVSHDETTSPSPVAPGTQTEATPPLDRRWLFSPSPDRTTT